MLRLVLLLLVLHFASSEWMRLPDEVKTISFHSNSTTMTGKRQIIMVRNTTQWNGEITCERPWNDRLFIRCQATPNVEMYMYSIKCEEVAGEVECNEHVIHFNNGGNQITKTCKENKFNISACYIEFYDSITWEVVMIYQITLLVLVILVILTIAFVGACVMRIQQLPVEIITAIPIK